jgi:hypothetical protein
MTLKCELCGKKFKRLEDAFVHPYSFLRPKIVHRHCVNHKVMIMSGFGPYMPITRIIDVAAPSIVFLIAISIFLLSLLPTTEYLLLFVTLFSALIVFRMHFLSYLFKAKREFYE